MNSNCIFKDICGKKYSAECDQHCIRYIEMDYLLTTSMLPHNYYETTKLIREEVDKDAYQIIDDICNNILGFVNQGKNLFIYSSTTGNGKSLNAARIMKSFFSSIWNGNGLRERGLWVHVPTFLLKIKENIDEKNDVNTIKQLLKIVDLVVWDDIATVRASDWELEILLSIIDYRIQTKKANIYTSNICYGIGKIIGERLKSRVITASQLVHFKGKDKRVNLV